jgi:hypothetical protein
MLRKLISIPEGVYYRGRFRATMAWSKVSKRRGEGDSIIADEQGSHGIEEPDRPLLDRVVSGKTNTTALQMRPAKP